MDLFLKDGLVLSCSTGCGSPPPGPQGPPETPSPGAAEGSRRAGRQEMDCTPILVDGHQSISRDIYIYKQDS